ncbi:MmcQ/YjbR family DNA-binding protein [Kibdelosporangium philippinense]|uniref:MmcQ/YjbR family DNA-binding protein n=1 Tax=Kibdelosporangium philippinense TaxID=211113 RepID=A0ABS8ZS10_9PSEU|nr:MmcQ/YjbR family DNA-binding protein [Kibdelosporangium philippinense]MCE7010457.1 MmcQ/YjbR family DNA-binding protein [Kibdelosporangium philippinense]
MADWEDVRRIALGLPSVVESTSGFGHIQWRVKDKSFIWERPLRKSDYEALGDSAPDGPILGVRVADVGVKEALIAADPGVYFTTPHFDGYPAILVQLAEIPVPELDELITEAWLDRAPKRMAKEFLAEH